MGWSKATKLADRVTTQGLVGVLVNDNRAAMVELNCETDFVARNETFKRFVDHVSRIVLHYTDQTEFDGDLWKVSSKLCHLTKPFHYTFLPLYSLDSMRTP